MKHYEFGLKYLTIAAEDVLGVVGCSNQNISTCPLSGPRSFNMNPCHIPSGTDKTFIQVAIDLSLCLIWHNASSLGCYTWLWPRLQHVKVNKLNPLFRPEGSVSMYMQRAQLCFSHKIFIQPHIIIVYMVINSQLVVSTLCFRICGICPCQFVGLSSYTVVL